MTNINAYQIEPIGILHSPFKEKFAIPRQPRLVPEAIGRLKMLPPYHSETCVRELRQFTHLWLLFMFHQNLDKGWRPSIRPPRLGGNKKVGVFASRSTFRPNGIGMSAVQLLDIEKTRSGIELLLGGVDLLDQTPIIDIKPYLPYADIIKEADGGFANERPASAMTVSFTAAAQASCEQYRQQDPGQYAGLVTLIEKILIEDPRPAYKKADPGKQNYGVQLHDLNITWEVIGEHSIVTGVTRRPIIQPLA